MRHIRSPDHLWPADGAAVDLDHPVRSAGDGAGDEGSGQRGPPGLDHVGNGEVDEVVDHEAVAARLR